jgi:prepilin-type N-terminal cleavage/methylation domain-containing protein
MKPVLQQEQGFTVVEVIIAIIVLTIGLLGLVASSALVTRMIARGQRAAVQTVFTTRRLEMARATACANQAGGTDVLLRAGVPVDSLTWRFVNRGNSTWQIIIRSKYQTDRGRWRTDSTETEVSCII